MDYEATWETASWGSNVVEPPATQPDSLSEVWFLNRSKSWRKPLVLETCRVYNVDVLTKLLLYASCSLKFKMLLYIFK